MSDILNCGILTV